MLALGLRLTKQADGANEYDVEFKKDADDDPAGSIGAVSIVANTVDGLTERTVDEDEINDDATLVIVTVPAVVVFIGI